MTVTDIGDSIRFILQSTSVFSSMDAICTLQCKFRSCSQNIFGQTPDVIKPQPLTNDKSQTYNFHFPQTFLIPSYLLFNKVLVLYWTLTGCQIVSTTTCFGLTRSTTWFGLITTWFGLTTTWFGLITTWFCLTTTCLRIHCRVYLLV